MKSKPKAAEHRNLVAYRERIFYGRRYWRDLKTTDWDDAIVLRDRLEELDGIEKRRGDVPKFDVFPILGTANIDFIFPPDLKIWIKMRSWDYLPLMMKPVRHIAKLTSNSPAGEMPKTIMPNM